MATWYLVVLVLLSIGRSYGSTCDMYDNGENYICQNIMGTFPNMNYGYAKLKCVNCIIRTFSESTFPHDNQLVSFNVSESGIQDISVNAFWKLSTVKALYLQHNRIRNIISGAFNGLKSVREIDLGYNSIEYLNGSIWKNLQVTYLRINNNKLSQIPNRSFEGLKALLYLDLSNNNINVLNSDSFHSLSQLNVLDLKGNRLCHIPLGAFKMLRDLRALNLMNNRLAKFSVGAFSGLRNLGQLYLSNNSIEVFEGDILLSLPHLDLVDISKNIIYYFDAHSIMLNSPNLRSIQIEDNLFSCGSLKNIVQYFRKAGVVIEISEGRYNVQNIDGIACTDMQVLESMPLGRFLGYAEQEAKNSQTFC